MNPADHFLKRAHTRARHGSLVWFLGLAVTACAVALGTHLGWWPAGIISMIALAVPAVAAVVLLAIWIGRSRRLTHAAHAHRLDTEWALAARLEASAELAADPSALATAQRADAAQHVAGRRLPSSGLWSSGFALLIVAGLALLAEIFTFSYRRLTAVPPTVAETTTLTAARADISASIVWKSPEAEIKATTIESIPLAALVSSRTGFRSLSLEISVNGEPRLSRLLESAALAPFTKAGDFPLALDLYLDELQAQEYDIISYHLRGERDTAQPTPVIVSPLQFIQIRPPREDVVRMQGGKKCADCQSLAKLLGALKAAQLHLLKQNFLLAHASIDHALPVWREENSLVAADQRLLAKKTAEARQFSIDKAMPTLAVDNFGQCVALMESAATQIADAANLSASKPQGQALGLITAIEKLLRKILSEGGSSQSASANKDPFKDPQKFKPTPRAETPAGELEELSRDQDAAAAKEPGANQAEIAAKLADLAAAQSLDAAAQSKTEQAAKDAADAARQLAQGDPEAARAPAAAAAQALREATATQDAAGRTAAQAILETLRREINAAERLTDPAARVAALATATTQLQTEAEQQQQTGSAEAARQLTSAAKTVQAAKQQAAAGKGEGESEGEGSGKSASTALAKTQASLTPRDQALARAARQIARGSGSGGGDSTAGSIAEMELGAQLASQLPLDSTTRELAQNLATALRRQSGNTIVAPDLRGAAEHLVVLLEAARTTGGRDEQVRRFNPDELDPTYRAAVETYFEKLSRDAQIRR